MAGWGERPREPERPSAMVAVRNAPAIRQPQSSSLVLVTGIRPGGASLPATRCLRNHPANPAMR
jgi:hypothetical protein